MTTLPDRRSLAWSGALLFALSLALFAGYAVATEVEAPLVHDEYAYLLSADTFAHGRLTNPPHPMARHFETFHVFQHPTYQAKYPPGQGMALALGQVLGHPIVGVWLSWALAIAAIHWALCALVPPRWALLGSMLVLCNPYLFQVWGETYWGGAVAAMGGALFFGGLLRLRRRVSALDGTAMAVGLFLLANSRPFEGLVSACFGVGPFVVLWRRRALAGERPLLRRRILVPLVVGAVAIVGWTLYYDWRLTGNPFRLPYFEFRPGQSDYADIRSYTGSPERSIPGKIRRIVLAYLGWPLALALPFVLRRWRERSLTFAAVAVYVVCVLSVAASRGWPHYVAPVTCLIAYLVVGSLRGLWHWRPRALGARPVGRLLALGFVGWHLFLWAHATGSRVLEGPQESWARDRLDMIARLEAAGGKHLVLVHYGRGRDTDKEWIYNRADIDGASVVWARDLGPEGNRELLDYFSDREVWCLRVPPYRPRLRPYAPEELPSLER